MTFTSGPGSLRLLVQPSQLGERAYGAAPILETSREFVSKHKIALAIRDINRNAELLFKYAPESSYQAAGKTAGESSKALSQA